MSEISLLRNKVYLASVLTLAICVIISSPDAAQFETVWLKRLKKQQSGSKQLFETLFGDLLKLMQCFV